MPVEHVYIRGRGITCSLGRATDEIITRIKNRDCKPADLPIKTALLNYTRPFYLIPGNDNERHDDLERYFYETLFETVSRAIKTSGLSEKEIQTCALFFGSTSIDMPVFERTYKNRKKADMDNTPYDSPGYGKIAEIVAKNFNIKGLCYTVTTACTSSANCLLYAASMIQAGHIERAIVTGYDLFNEVGLYGFESMKLIEPFAYRPFDKERIGIILGEGCGAVVLDREPGSAQDFRFLGGSNACDNFSVTTHNLEGDDIAFVIHDALKNSGLSTGDIDAIKAHATGSPANDTMEFNGMKRAFGDSLPVFTGLKPYIGHTLGACGVIELVIIIEAIGCGFIPSTPGFKEVDKEINARPLTEDLAINSATVMLNFFGFGGNCTSFIISNKE